MKARRKGLTITRRIWKKMRVEEKGEGIQTRRSRKRLSMTKMERKVICLLRALSTPHGLLHQGGDF